MPEEKVVSSVSELNFPELSVKIEALQDALNRNLPGYEGMIRTIHTILTTDDSLVHMLSEEQIGTIITGLGKKTNVVIVESTKKATSKTTLRGKKLTDINVEDLD